MTTAIIVSGAPASGKSVFSRSVSQRLGIHLLSKDSIKEALFDELGCSSRATSIELGKASFVSLLDQCRDRVLASDSLIVESAFRRGDESILRGIFQNYKIVHVHCTASDAMIIARFEQRALSEERHPGHLDTENVQVLSRLLTEGVFDLEIRDAIRIDVCTSDFDSPLYMAAKEKVLEEYTNQPTVSGRYGPRPTLDAAKPRA